MYSCRCSRRPTPTRTNKRTSNLRASDFPELFSPTMSVAERQGCSNHREDEVYKEPPPSVQKLSPVISQLTPALHFYQASKEQIPSRFLVVEMQFSVIALALALGTAIAAPTVTKREYSADVQDAAKNLVEFVSLLLPGTVQVFILFLLAFTTLDSRTGLLTSH